MTDDQTAAALRALARDGERAKQRMDLLFERIDKAQGSADSANRAVARLSKVVGAQGEPEQAKPPAANRPQTVQRTPSPMSWLTTTDEDAARQELAALIEWCRDVYLRYREADLVECWYWHPAVVAELLALRTAWIEAYEGESPSPTAAVDWHDRHRTGVVRRVNAELMGCSLTHHTPTGDRSFRPIRLPVDLAGEVAAWWASTHGATAAPSPTPAMLAEAQAARHAEDVAKYGRR